MLFSLLCIRYILFGCIEALDLKLILNTLNQKYFNLSHVMLVSNVILRTLSLSVFYLIGTGCSSKISKIEKRAANLKNIIKLFNPNMLHVFLLRTSFIH